MESDLPWAGAVAVVGFAFVAVISSRVEGVNPLPGAPMVPHASCPSCGYELLGLPTSGLCPECGNSYEPYPAVDTRRTVVEWRTDRLPRVLASLTIPWIIGLGAMPFALLTRTSVPAPFDAWHTVLHAFNWGYALDVAVMYLPLALLLMLVARAESRLVFWGSLCVGTAGGYLALRTVPTAELYDYASMVWRARADVVVYRRPSDYIISWTLAFGLVAFLLLGLVQAAAVAWRTQMARRPSGKVAEHQPLTSPAHSPPPPPLPRAP